MCIKVPGITFEAVHRIKMAEIIVCAEIAFFLPAQVHYVLTTYINGGQRIVLFAIQAFAHGNRTAANFRILVERSSERCEIDYHQEPVVRSPDKLSTG